MYKTVLLIVVSLISIGLLGSSIYEYNQIQSVNTEKAALETKIQQSEEAYQNMQDSLDHTQTEIASLKSALEEEQNKNSSYTNELDQANTALESYQRLANNDPQLLQKYSKIYFLNENYTPSALTTIDTRFLFNKSKQLQIHDRVWPFLLHLLTDAQKAGIDLEIASAYRSFGTQATLKSTYKVIYGAGTANSFSADQGYSEHQLGTTVDFTTAKIGGALTGFEKTNSYTWLLDNAYKYGFILSYPPNNSYYIYEPWHWRFVGLDLALRLHNDDKHFYDLDQRDINKYLEYFFNGTTTAMTQ